MLSCYDLCIVGITLLSTVCLILICCRVWDWLVMLGLVCFVGDLVDLFRFEFLWFVHLM